MPASRDGGVRKQSTGYYHQSVQKLQAVVEAKLKEVAVLDAAREQMAEREQAGQLNTIILVCVQAFVQHSCMGDQRPATGLATTHSWVPHGCPCGFMCLCWFVSIFYSQRYQALHL